MINVACSSASNPKVEEDGGGRKKRRKGRSEGEYRKWKEKIRKKKRGENESHAVAR